MQYPGATLPSSQAKPLSRSAKRWSKLKRFITRGFSYVASPFTIGLAVSVGLSCFAFHYYRTQHDSKPASASAGTMASLVNFFRFLHDRSIDLRFRDRGQIPGSDRVAILAIDERSIEEEGRWPWPRTKLADLVERSMGLGAKLIAFDIIFSEEDTNSSIPTLRRLRRELSRAGEMDADLDQRLKLEIEKANADRKFAAVVAKHSDALIMGAYFEGEIVAEPHSDLCLQRLFERTSEHRYWKRETSPLVIEDRSSESDLFPQPFSDHLANYFTQLEVTASARWFDEHQRKAADIDESLRDLDANLPATLTQEAYPGLATLWLNGDTANLMELLAELKPDFANDEGVRQLLQAFSSAFSRKEMVSLQAEIRQAGLDYCQRFLTANDDLLKLGNFKSLWGSGPSIDDAYKEMSFEPLWMSYAMNRPGLTGRPLDRIVEEYKSRLPHNSVINVPRWWVNIPILSFATKHSGYFNAVQDSDGSIRRSALFVRHGDSYMPSLSLKTFLVDQTYTAKARISSNQSASSRGGARKSVHALDIYSSDNRKVMSVPVDASGHLLINYAGGRHMFPYVSAADILSDQPYLTLTQQTRSKGGGWDLTQKNVDKLEFMKNKLLIAGATAIGVYDLRVTPFDENYPGVETHANVLSNLLIAAAQAKGEAVPDGAPGFLKPHPHESRWMGWALLLGGVVLSGLLSYFGSVAGLAITTACITAIYLLDKYIYFRSGVVMTTVFPVAMVSLNFIALTSYKYFTEERKKRELKGTFEKYVSPSIVAEVLSDPENVELGGKKMELTVMFSDVRGFTTISEKLEPRALSDLLNSYLTPMTNLVFEHKGTLDKYMGDAIMAFWGAPIHFPDHAAHACRCALRMIDKLKDLQRTYREQGLPEIDIGIGLNTGEMSVGNMGSDTVRSYTVMGDAVNLGSRLEGINKQYGTRIMISQFTQDQIKERFTTREVDWVRVKGKAQPVRIFELISEGAPDPRIQSLLLLFSEGFDLYHQKSFAAAIERFQKALDLNFDDPVSRLYLERCQEYVQEPPPENWDGVFTMTSK